jgi:hypothetical protein
VPNNKSKLAMNVYGSEVKCQNIQYELTVANCSNLLQMFLTWTKDRILERVQSFRNDNITKASENGLIF